MPLPDDRIPDDLISFALSAGLDRVGVCDASVLDRARTEIVRRKDEGLADTMQFTFRNPERSTDPSRALDGAQSIIVGARRYVYPGDDADIEVGDRAHRHTAEVWARVARYAQADHYAALRHSLERVAERLRSDGHRATVLVDANDLVDREVAWKAGIGWFGKSANILIPGGGSWYVLGSVVTTAEIAPTDKRVADGCGTCRVCIDACPTAAIVADGVIDARRCLAWLVQRGGVFPFEYRVALHDRMYGCDDCQETCPPNVRFRERRPGRSLDAAPGPLVDVMGVLDASDAELMAAYGRWYIAGRNPTWLRRNALIILGNVAPLPVSAGVRRVIERYATDEDPFLRTHAVWAAARLGIGEIRALMANDTDPLVRDELQKWSNVPVRSHPSAESTR